LYALVCSDVHSQTPPRPFHSPWSVAPSISLKKYLLGIAEFDKLEALNLNDHIKGTRTVVYVTLIFIQLLFGVNFVASKYVLNHINSWDFVFVRFFVSGLTLSLITLAIYAYKKKISSVILPTRYILWAIALGILGFALSQTLFLQGLKMTTAANTSIFSTTIPLLAYLVAILRGKKQFNFVDVFGFTTAFLGVLILKGVDQVSFDKQNLVGDLVVFLGCFSIATFISFSKDFFTKVPSVVGTAYLLTFGSLFLAPVTFYDSNFAWIELIWQDTYFMSALLFTIFGATLLTYLLSNWTLKKISSETLALYIFIQPVVATLLAYFFLDGELKWHMGVSLVFIAAGVGAVSLKEAHERNSNR